MLLIIKFINFLLKNPEHIFTLTKIFVMCVLCNVGFNLNCLSNLHSIKLKYNYDVFNKTEFFRKYQFSWKIYVTNSSFQDVEI